MTNVKVWKRMKEERKSSKKVGWGDGMGGWHDYDCLHKRRPLYLRSHASTLLSEYEQVPSKKNPHNFPVASTAQQEMRITPKPGKLSFDRPSMCLTIRRAFYQQNRWRGAKRMTHVGNRSVVLLV